MTESGGPPAPARAADTAPSPAEAAVPVEPLVEPLVEPPREPPPAWVGVALRVVGGVVAVALAVVTAAIEIFYSPLRVGGVLVGASVVLAVVVNFYLPRFTVAVTGAGWAALLPPLAWMGLAIAGAGRRSEGDILITSWVGLVMIFAGSLAFAAGGYRLMVPPPRRSL